MVIELLGKELNHCHKLWFHLLLFNIHEVNKETGLSTKKLISGLYCFPALLSINIL